MRGQFPQRVHHRAFERFCTHRHTIVGVWTPVKPEWQHCIARANNRRQLTSAGTNAGALGCRYVCTRDRMCLRNRWICAKFRRRPYGVPDGCGGCYGLTPQRSGASPDQLFRRIRHRGGDLTITSRYGKPCVVQPNDKHFLPVAGVNY